MISKYGTGSALTDADKTGVNFIPKKDIKAHVKIEDINTGKVEFFDGVNDAARKGFNNMNSKSNISRTISGKHKSYLGKKISMISHEDYLKEFNKKTAGMTSIDKATTGSEISTPITIKTNAKIQTEKEEPKKEIKKSKIVYNHVLKHHMLYLKSGGEFNTSAKAILKAVSKRLTVKEKKGEDKDE
jgi:hypothetical protein